MGTVDYMSPEQCNSPRDVDVRSDVYSLGATLYKLLCGRVPFADRETLLGKLRAVAVDDVPDIANFRKDLPAELISVVQRMLARDLEERFATATGVAEALAPFCGDANLPALLTGDTPKNTRHGDESTKTATCQPVGETESTVQVKSDSVADQVSVLAFSQDGKYLVSAGLDDNILVWDIARNEVARQIVGAGDQHLR